MRSRITEAEIRDLVFAFYERVRDDPRLGPIFEERLAGKWDAHLERMCDFWSTVMLASGRYRGNPVEAHRRVESITTTDFDRWIELFEKTAEDVLPPHVAMDVVGRSMRMRQVLERGIGPSATPPMDANQPVE